MFNHVVEAGVIHSGENSSNHCPIYTKIKLDNIDTSTESVKSPGKVCWARASEEAKEKYICTLSTKLNSVQVPVCVQCVDLHCTVHTEELEDYTMNVLEAVEDTAKECLPSKGGGSSNKQHNPIIPG